MDDNVIVEVGIVVTKVYVVVHSVVEAELDVTPVVENCVVLSVMNGVVKTLEVVEGDPVVVLVSLKLVEVSAVVTVVVEDVVVVVTGSGKRTFKEKK